MVKKILITALLGVIICSCDLLNSNRFTGDIIEEKREIENVSKVRIGYGFDVNMRVGEKESLVIQAPRDALPYIYSEVEDNRLVVKLDPDVRSSQLSVKKIFLEVKSIEGIRISGTTTLHCDDPISADTLSVGTSGKSRAELLVDSRMTRIVSSGASKVTIEGNTKVLDIQSVSGKSSFNGFDFTADKTFVVASGKSTVRTHTIEELNVEASGESRIRYMGDPVIYSQLSGEANVKNSTD